MTSAQWRPDLLGDDFEACGIPLGPDPDGEDEISATLVRHVPGVAAAPTTAAPTAGRGPRAVLHIHGFTDYFFQRHLAERFAARGIRFYALDLRKCGRSLRTGQTPHFVRDLAAYDAEIGYALRIILSDGPAQSGTAAADGSPAAASVLLMGHSTGGLILPLWLDRMRTAALSGDSAAARVYGAIDGLVLNSPWFDLQGPAWLRSAGTVAVDAVGRVRPTATLPTAHSEVYGRALHASFGGEWSYRLDWKPLSGFPIRAGWLRAVRRGQAGLHRGLDVGVPSLVLRSESTVFTTRPSAATHAGDTVLDVRQIARWSGCLGGQNSTVPLHGALHDVFLSAEPVRTRALDTVDRWIDAAATHVKETPR